MALSLPTLNERKKKTFMTRLMFSLKMFTYIVIAGCLDHRKVLMTKTTKKDKKSLQTKVNIVF